MKVSKAFLGKRQAWGEDRVRTRWGWDFFFPVKFGCASSLWRPRLLALHRYQGELNTNLYLLSGSSNVYRMILKMLSCSPLIAFEFSQLVKQESKRNMMELSFTHEWPITFCTKKIQILEIPLFEQVLEALSGVRINSCLFGEVLGSVKLFQVHTTADACLRHRFHMYKSAV